MSADNGIYILETPRESGEGFEYRVIHAQAIENIFNDEEDGNAVQIIEYYGDSTIFNTMDESLREAHRLYKDYEWPEYGIQSISLPHCFTYYRMMAEAEEYKNPNVLHYPE